MTISSDDQIVDLCRHQDDFVFDRGAHWVVRLSNNEVILMDDDRPGVRGHRSAWIRLRTYVGQNGLAVTQLYIQNRGRKEHPMPDNQLGYYFGHQAVSWVGLDSNWRDGSNGTLGYFVLGHISRQTKELICQCWKVPELLPAEFVEGHTREVRPIDPNNPGLIINP